MKAKVSGKVALGILAAFAVAVTPIMAQADSLSQSDNSKSAEIVSLKKQLFACHHPKRYHHRRAACVFSRENKVFEKQTIIEKPVIIEKVVEKQVTVEKPGELILERPMEVERKVVVEHAAHHRHLLHLGIPFINVNLF
jgi:hypothetical protein